jgi:Flp pilus assembly protein TadD
LDPDGRARRERGAGAVGRTGGLILGPGSLVEITGPDSIKVHYGELEITAPDGHPLKMNAGGAENTPMTGRQQVLVKDGAMRKLEVEPNWLKSFKGAVTTESLGSLVAKVDGREVPLTVGYHKVTVDIRDQIARTVIEESFVNHTPGTLEGVFYFPLPQDASISGFGMWIGDQLVEADVVEKERAREIYETILRERRDPGLLEWSGGSLFKARVFPIFAHSEKRIKMSYTQVLPYQGGRYRYSYALQSEMLAKHPLRELALEVKVQSALPLKSVTCTSHTARTEKTGNAAHVEFAAQEYRPDRDFEVEIETDTRSAPAVVLPHRRGDDGYFALLLAPPGGDGEWRRTVLPDGEPMELLVLADTSGSMDTASRKARDAFLATLLASLGPRDRFNLATCDVTCDWMWDQSVGVDGTNTARALETVAGRRSLGWSDLDAALASALARAGAGTQVVYVGDGVGTTGDADPIAFADRLRRMAEGRAGTFHSVATGSLIEPSTLKAIAAIGGGSFRRMEGPDAARAAARELLGEMVTPGVKDVRIRFEGFRTARVYPGVLPNLPAGRQQIVLGRYLPEGGAKKGAVMVTGTLAGKAVEYRAEVALPEDGQGNSFLPRLWARLHLDELLAQGRSPEIKDEIVALSQEYQIMTPYTSFLVLESDEDRERFGVKRQFRIRDGEKFFAEGREEADFALAQKQMKAAGNWRLQMRRQALREAAGMGREESLAWMETVPMNGGEVYAWSDVGGMVKSGAGFSTISGMGGGGSFRGSLGGSLRGKYIRDEILPVSGFDGFDDYISEDKEDQKNREGDEDLNGREFPREAESLEEVDGFKYEIRDGDDADGRRGDRLFSFKEISAGKPGNGPVGMDARRSRSSYIRTSNSELSGRLGGRGFGGQSRYGMYPVYDLFPAPMLAGPAAPGRPFKSNWTPEARQLAESLVRTGLVHAVSGGLEFISERTETNPRRNQVLSVLPQTTLVSPGAWLVRVRYESGQSELNWCDGRERGVLSPALQLGRRRDALPGDLNGWGLPIHYALLRSLEESYRHMRADILPGDAPERVVLKLVDQSTPSAAEIRITIDTARHVVLMVETLHKGKSTGTETFSDFVEAAGGWWATRHDVTYAETDRRIVWTQRIRELAPDAFKAAYIEALQERDDAIVISQPQPSVAGARQALFDGKESFDAHLVMMQHFAAGQQWERAREHYAQAAKRAAGKPGLAWVRNALLAGSRDRETLRVHLLEQAGRIAAHPGREEMYAAGQLVQFSQQTGEYNETLALLDVLKSVYDRQPDVFQAGKKWRVLRAHSLRSSGRADAAFEGEQALARELPADVEVQQRYAAALEARGDDKKAEAWLRGLLEKKATWSSSERDVLRLALVRLIENRGRFAEAATYLETIIADQPETSTPYNQYLSALIRSDQEPKVVETIRRWLELCREEGEWSPSTTWKVYAAIQFATGQGYNLYNGRVDEQWLEPLSGAARALARHKAQYHMAGNIMGNSYFRDSDAGSALRREFAGTLLQDLDPLTPQQINSHITWIEQGSPAVEAETWLKIAAGVEARWSAEKDPLLRYQLGQTLASLLQKHADAARHLAFLRKLRSEALEGSRPAHALQLFEALLRQPWSTEAEEEAFSLLGHLSDTNQTAEIRLMIDIKALHQITDRMLEARRTGLLDEVEHKENLSRPELQALHKECLRKAREGYADQLAFESDRHGDALRRWIAAERLHLDVQLARDAKSIAGECWEVVGAAPAAGEKARDPLEEALRLRHLGILEFLATRPKADPALLERLSEWYDRAAAAEPMNDMWKMAGYRVLLLADRADAMEAALRAWIRPAYADNTWRLMLGYLLAEQNRIPEAIQQFEEIRKAGELRPAEYRTLADWYMVRNQKDAHEAALVDALMVAEEYELNNWLYQQRNKWNSGPEGMPATFDPQTVRVFSALFRKTSWPANQLGLLREFYGRTRDSRLLQCLAEGVTGQSAQRVYPFVGQMQEVLKEILEEATCDSVSAHIEVVRKRSPTPVDQCALDLLEVQVRRRAAELLNQPGPHVDAAIAALQRAFKGSWAEGERRHMAEMLAELGAIKQAPLADEVLRELRVLHEEEKPGTFDRLRILHSLARALWNHSREDQAIEELEAGLNEFRAASGGLLPQSANETLVLFVEYLESRKFFMRGEKVLLAEVAGDATQQHKNWLMQRLYKLYKNALLADGATSLGQGAEMYKAVERRILGDLNTNDQSHRSELVTLLCELYRVAHGRKLPGVVDDIKTFAHEGMPGVLAGNTSNPQDLVARVAETLHGLAGPLEGLTFLIERIENEPTWLRYARQDGWAQHSWRLAQWRSTAGNLGGLEERLLKVACEALRKDLESREQRNRIVYVRHNSYFWEQKKDDFARVAEEVLARKKTSGAAVLYIAQYLYHGLDLHDRAITVLLEAHQEKRLEEGGLAQLVVYLHERKRFAESIPVLEPLIQSRPGNITYRCQLMHAFFQTGKEESMRACLKKADADFHAAKLWNESTISSLARACVLNKLFPEAVAYCKELIPLHQRIQPNRGIGNGTLSQYHTWLADAHSGLGQTLEAVDAACGAIVSWGSASDQRRQAMDVLMRVVRNAQDLDRLAESLNRKAEETGMENPAVRKALGRILLEKRQFAQAVAQLRIAVEAEPDDPEIYAALVSACDQQNDPEGALRELYAGAESARRDINMYKDIAARCEKLNRPAEAERARTMIVEILPNESESHTLLAGIRQEQNRWNDAILHWRQVARIRSLEPTGLQRLAEALIHEKKWPEAREVIRLLMDKPWPTRFGDVRQQAVNLLQAVERGEKQ